LRLVDPRRLDVVASVPEADISRVVPGASARIAGPAGADPIRLTVVRREVEGVGPDGTMPFRLVFSEPSPLTVDARVEIDIDAEERANAVLIPVEAVLRQGTEAAVMVANGSRAERRVVTLGIEDVQRVEVTSGLRAGELVITRGQLGLADGAAISVAAER
jgi:membrane fusion protein (multidrug efflux system)